MRQRSGGISRFLEHLEGCSVHAAALGWITAAFIRDTAFAGGEPSRYSSATRVAAFASALDSAQRAVTWIEDMPDGEHCLKVEYEVDAGVHEQFEAARAAAGAPGNLSYARTVGFGDIERQGPVAMLIAGQASNFSQADISRDARLLPGEESIALAELVEFAADDACRIVVVVAEQHSLLREYGPAALSALLYPALQAL